jgi:hypothetical protein
LMSMGTLLEVFEGRWSVFVEELLSTK